MTVERQSAIRMARRRITAVVALLSCTLLGGCLEKEFDRRSIVAQWRALAIVADPPVTQLGDTVRFEPLVVRPDGTDAVHGEDGITFLWAACVRPERVPGLSGLQYEPESPSQACGGAELAITDPELGLTVDADGSAQLDTAMLLAQLEALGFGIEQIPEFAAMQLGIPEELTERLLIDVGLPFVVELRVCEGPTCENPTPDPDAIRITAFKRFLLNTGTATGENPPPVRFRICPGEERCADDEGQWLSAATSGSPFECTPESGTVPVLGADAHVVLDPEDGQEAWIEEYTVLDIQARFQTREERAFYSWFSTDGRFDQEITKNPADEEIWRTPAEPGTYPLWLVVRDGHAGTAACRATVEVR